ncbi:MAG: COX15/CtaA family protein [Acidobacteriaceae bacterium]
MSRTIVAEEPSNAVAGPPSSGQPHASSSLRRFAWFVLAYNILVILWGGVVRASGSGAGCGDQWPLCQGAAIPQSPQFHTIVEFTHRLMSGGALILIAALLVWIWSATTKGSLARWSAVASLVLVLNEAFLGALLVTVAAHSGSQVTAVSVFSCHLANTLLLLAALALTAEFLSMSRRYRMTALRHGSLIFPALAILTTLLTGITGSLVALGETLYPSPTLLAAIRQDFSPAAPLLLRLRWIHPVTAFIAGAFVAWLLVQAFRHTAPSKARSLGIAVLVTILAQYLLGVADVLLRAPIWLQILHLLGADLFWIFLILLAADYCLVEKSPKHKSNRETLATVVNGG